MHDNYLILCIHVPSEYLCTVNNLDDLGIHRVGTKEWPLNCSKKEHFTGQLDMVLYSIAKSGNNFLWMKILNFS